jgi:hypothetical protein
MSNRSEIKLYHMGPHVYAVYKLSRLFFRKQHTSPYYNPVCTCATRPKIVHQDFIHVILNSDQQEVKDLILQTSKTSHP